MTFPDLLEILESAARTVDPNATYYRGRKSDVSLASHAANTNIIYVLDTMQAEPDTDNNFERWNIRIAFIRQDSTSSESMEANQVQPNEESRETIFAVTHELARNYYAALLNEDALMLTGTPRYTQITRETQGTYTGWGLDFSVFLEVGCVDVSIQDGIYQNAESAPSFTQTIKRGEVYTAPRITVTDSDGSTFEQPANENVVCTFIPGGSCTYPVKVNGVLYGTITTLNCEEININISV